MAFQGPTGMKNRAGERHDKKAPSSGDLPQAQAVFLVGFMGAGKSSVGRALSRRLGWAFEDLDDRIEPPCVAELPQPGEIAFGGKVDAAFTLNRFDHDGDGFRVDFAGERIEIAERTVHEAGQHRFDALVVFRLRGGRNRRQRTAME